ncbi:MAG: M48 family metallopeptidase [Hyphomicrobiaceae bacterium]
MARRNATRPSCVTGIQDIGAPVEIRRHPAARRLTLRVSRTQRAVIVTLPMKCDIGEADTFLDRNIDWVRERLGSLPEPVPFVHDAIIPLRGAPHRLVYAGEVRRGPPVHATTPADSDAEGSLEVSGAIEHAGRRLTDWLFDEARRDLDRSVQHHAGFLGLTAKRIVVRDQSSRWGSCSTTGTLSFSWRLILAPPLVLDYVAAHEVAHLAEMNHGRRFWALVRRTMPQMETAKAWLQRCGMDLHRYGPATVARSR